MNSATKRLSVALGVLFCLVIVGFFVNADPEAKGKDRRSATRKDVPKLPAVDQNRIAAIELSDSGTTTRLEKSGDEWVLPAFARAPAVKTRVEDLLKSLVGFERSTHVAYSVADPAKYRLDPQQFRRLKLFDERGTPLIDLVVGMEDPSGGAAVGERGTFVKLADKDDVFSFPKSLMQKIRSATAYWMEKQLFPADPKAKNALIGTAERVTLEFADVPPPAPTSTQPATSRPEPDPPDLPRFRVVLEAKEEEVTTEEAAPGPTPSGAPTTRKVEKRRTWRMVEPMGEVDPVYAPTVEGVIRTLVFATCVDVAGGDSTAGGYGFEMPSATAEVAFADGSTRKIVIGSKATPPEDPALKMQGARYATSTGSTRVFRLADHAVQAFRRKPVDFKQPDLGKPFDPTPPPISVPDDGGDSRPVK
jgi:hypothetical protein